MGIGSSLIFHSSDISHSSDRSSHRPSDCLVLDSTFEHPSPDAALGVEFKDGLLDGARGIDSLPRFDIAIQVARDISFQEVQAVILKDCADDGQTYELVTDDLIVSSKPLSNFGENEDRDDAKEVIDDMIFQ